MNTSRNSAHKRRDNSSPPQESAKRDLKRSFLIFGLGILSWVATYVGMLELIEANMGDLPLIHKVIIGFSVAMLMTMIVWLLDQIFKPHAFLTKAFYAGGYIFLSLISVGFGFGFYWKVLESRAESSRSAESAVTQVQGSLNAASTRLEQLQATLVQLTQVSTEKAEVERAKGTSCPNSRPGDGPRRKMREEDAQRFSFASKFVEGRIGAVKADMSTLDVDLAKIMMDDKSIVDLKTGTRNEFMRSLGRKLDMTVTGFNAFRTDPQLRQVRTDLADRAEKSTFGDPKGGMFSCPDPQLQTALRGVVKAIDQLPELQKPEVAAVEGSEATIEAFRRLTTTFYGMLAFKLPPSADELRELQKKAVQSVESAPSDKARQLAIEHGGLSKRDYVPLAVALFVDICLFLVSMVSRPANRLGGLVPKMQAAEQGPVIQILSRFNDIHKDRQIRENFEIFRHVVFDMNGDYYVAVPLDAPPKLNPEERETLRVEAQLLANLFSSFEKEKIFKRTLLPTTGSIQKRLKRQGSKFAGAEAFRVYKFTDGAWSDIILGAVMGAARRIEEEKTFRSPQYPPMGRPNLGPIPLTGPGMNGPGSGGVQMAGPPRGGPRPQPPSPAPNIGQASMSQGMSAGPYPRTSASQGVRMVGPGMSGPPRNNEPPTLRRAPGTSTPLDLDPGHEARFGPYAKAYQPEPFRPAPTRPGMAPSTAASGTSESADLPDAANGNTMPASAPQAASNNSTVVVTLPHVNESNVADGQTKSAAPLATTAPTVDVTLSRDTATISMPAPEAASPGGLRAALAKAIKLIAPAGALPKAEPLKSEAPAFVELAELEDLEDLNEPHNDDILTPADIAFIGRMAPPAAE